MPSLILGPANRVRLLLPTNDQRSRAGQGVAKTEINGDRYVRGDVPPADRGDLRRAQRFAEGGIVSVANIVGLVLSVLVAVLLGAALIFPERF
jgi:hypothetical protein